jgi:altronate dehydratase large subunit
MDTSMGLGACGTADMLAGGAQVMAYTTGRGNPVGSPLGPVIKITATRNTVETLPDIVDFDASPVLYGEETVEECGVRLLDEFVAVANGKLTRAEESGHIVFAIGKMAV